MKYNGVIENKLRLIGQKVTEIKSWNINSLEELKSSSLLQNASERALQVAIELMIEVSERILALNKVPPRSSAAAGLKAIQDLGVIKDSGKYVEMIRFRNFIVHRYEKIDLEIIYGILRNKLHLFADFVEEIRNS